MKKESELLPVASVCFFLVAIVWFVFGQTLGHEFLSYDDRAYVYGNPIVASGVSLRGIAWAFTHNHAGNWHPLTTLSHMVDSQVFGSRAGGHHFTNVFLHTVATLLLFLVFWRLTKALWQSAIVAAVFAIHPVHVESVAWVAERKDLLSGIFFMLTLGAYARYAARPSLGRYLTMSILFAFGLMSKPMLVTVPFVLLLLDYWPLARSQRLEIRGQKSGVGGQKETFVKLVVEKVPLLVLSSASCVATLIVQRQTTSSLENLPFWWRIENAIVSCVIYLRQMFWPVDLAAFYPHPQGRLPILHVVLAAALLLFITIAALLLRKTRPYFLVGWLWYLGMLAPVLGIVQVGLQAHADRYTYLPHIGLYLIVVWGVNDLLGSRSQRKVALGFASVIVVTLMFCARTQAAYWENNETLWNRALAVTSDNDVAHNNLGNVLLARGQFDDAIAHFQEALSIRSRQGESQYGLGAALSNNNLGTAFFQKGRVTEAIIYFQQALQISPDYADAHYNLGRAFLARGEIDNGIVQVEKTLAIQPDDAEAHTTLATALLQRGSLGEAIDHYERAVKATIPSIFALNNLAWILATCPDATVRNGPKALALAQGALKFSSGQNPVFVRTLAAACAENGQFDAAIAGATRASELARAQNDAGLANEIDGDLTLYRGHSPLRDSSLSAGAGK